MIWLLRLMTTVSRFSGGYGFIVAWETDIVDEFVRTFPEARRTLRVYTLGPNVSPMLSRAAKRAEKAGYLEAGSIGCEDARAYNQRTWSRTWSITPAGRRFLASLPPSA